LVDADHTGISRTYIVFRCKEEPKLRALVHRSKTTEDLKAC